MSRKVKSIKEELLKKAREALIAAVQIYNNPAISFKTESFVTLAIIGWTYLMHAYYRSIKLEYRYCTTVNGRNKYDRTKHGAFKRWELERCIDDHKCPLAHECKNNLKFLIGLRHEIEHQMTMNIDEFLSAKLQACAINFDYYICSLFGDKYKISDQLALSIQFSPLTHRQRETLNENSHITTNVRNFVVEFEDALSDKELESPRYAYRVLFTPLLAKRKGQADEVVEFISSDSPIANEVTKSYAVLKETEKQKYLPSEIVKIMQGRGYRKFSMNKHVDLWKSKDAKNPKYSYGVLISKTWYWYEVWLNVVNEYCKVNEEKLK